MPSWEKGQAAAFKSLDSPTCKIYGIDEDKLYESPWFSINVTPPKVIGTNPRAIVWTAS